MTLYRNIMRDSWQSTIRFKYLWFFGLFALILGNGGEYEIFFRSIFSNENNSSLWTTFFAPFLNWDVLTNLGTRFWDNPFLVLEIIFTYIFVLFIFLFIAWMMNVSEIAIVNSTAKQVKGEEHDLRMGMREGILNIWPVLFLNFAVKILIFLFLILLGYLSGSIFVIALFLIVIPFLMSLSFVTKYTICEIIIRKEKMKNAVILAWQLFKKNWIISLELAMLLYLFTILAVIVFMFLSFNIEKLFEILATTFPIISFNLFVVMVPIIELFTLAFVLSLLSVFQITTWTKLFLELDSKGGKSKIERLFSR